MIIRASATRCAILGVLNTGIIELPRGKFRNTYVIIRFRRGTASDRGAIRLRWCGQPFNKC